MNEAPSGVLLLNTVLPPDVSVGDTVTSLTCLDEDHGDTHTFSLRDSAGDLFVIEEDKLKVGSSKHINTSKSGCC